MAPPETELGPQLTLPGEVSTRPIASQTADPAADLGADAEPSPPRKRPEPKLCGVCGTQPGKYKCPRCSMPYCSVACNKQHKENHPPDAPKPEPSPATNTDQPQTEVAETDQDPYSILLDHRDTFQRLFAKYPSLPAALSRIQDTTLPPPDNPDSLSTPTSRFPSLLNGVRANTPRQRQQPWTRDVGLRRGAEALRRARTDPGDTGDGVREFCDLVRFLLSSEAAEEEQRRKKRKGGAGEVVDMVREEVAAEEARVIARLLREESDR